MPKKKVGETEKSRIATIIAKHWWKFGALILCGGIAWSGYEFKIGPFSCSKQQVKLKGDKK